jgi:transcriptional regulator with XRE-family HTH domain
VKNPALLLAFGTHLRTLRKQRGLSQQALADEAEISWPTVQRVEAGTQSPTLEVLDALAQALGLSLSELLRLPDASEMANCR